MSRVVVYDRNNYSAGEFRATVNRGWQLLGSPSTSGGASVSIKLPDLVAEKTWLNFGGLISVEHPTLPPWVGFVDPPWSATLPVNMIAYDAHYALQLRTPDAPINLIGAPATIIEQALEIANRQEDLFIRLGEVQGISSGQITKLFEQRPLWEQIANFAVEQGIEMILRPRRENKRLIFYLDLSAQFGQEVSYVLHDGARGNMRILSATVEGPIYNRVIGIGSQSANLGRLSTTAQVDGASKSAYRLRSWVEQFRDVSAQAILNAKRDVFLKNFAAPRLKLQMEIKEDAFPFLRLGNRIPTRCSSLWLPGGRRGWTGNMRLMAMAYDEDRNVVTTEMEAKL